MSNMPEALPDEVVKQIWHELQSTVLKDVSPEMLSVIVKGEAVLTKPVLLEFCQAAMEHPHYAAPRDISAALNLPSTVVAHAMTEVRKKAREAR